MRIIQSILPFLFLSGISRANGEDAFDSPPVWVNEIQVYDNHDGDTIEFVCKSGDRVLGWVVQEIYRSLDTLATQHTAFAASRQNPTWTCPETSTGYFKDGGNLSLLNGINGPISVCLFDILSGEVFQFISFGLDGTPTVGACAGMTPEISGVVDDNVGLFAQLEGEGCEYEDFSWRSDPNRANPNQIPNIGQTFHCPEPEPPAPVGGADGDPHILDWGNEWYDYHGECDMVLLDAPSFDHGLGLTAHIRTEIRYDYSFIEAAAIKIGSEVLEVGSFGDYFLNGVSNAKMPATIAGFPITYEEKGEQAHFWTVDMKEHGTVTLKAYKDLVGIKFEGTMAQDYGDSVGLMGTFGKGTHLARDGKTILADHNEFGQEWQVQKDEPLLFQTKAPAGKCVLPKAHLKTQRRLGETISQKEAELACAGHQQSFEQCVYDVIATGDLGVADAGAF